MESIDQAVLALISAVGGVAGWKGLSLILSRLGLGMAQSQAERNALANMQTELVRVNGERDAAIERELAAHQRAADAVLALADLRSTVGALNMKVEMLTSSNQRLESELAEIKKGMNHAKPV